MKKKNILYTVYASVFVGICLAPSVLMPFMKADSSKENRALSELPKIKTEEGKINFELFSQFETYFSEHFALRTELVTLDGIIKSNLLGTSSNEDVIVGKEGWLYYTPTSDDYMNINTLSDRGINNINHNLSLLSDYCESVGASFTFTVAPNKNSVYPEYMPYNYIETENQGNLERLEAVWQADFDEWFSYVTSSQPEKSLLVPELDTYDSYDTYDYCNLREALLEAKNKTTSSLYHKTDTHWNDRGALIARNALLNGKWEGMWNTAEDWSGDLAEMLYPAGVPMDTRYYLEDYAFTYQYVGRFRGLDDINIKTTNESAVGNLLMYRDSFGEAILPYMAESFATAEFTRAVPYNTASITEGTTVILEIVERNLGDLQKYAPVMPAPVYEGELPVGETSTEAAIEIEESGSYYHIYGMLGESFFKDSSARIFLSIDDTVYEAFNCFEDKLLGYEGETSDNGFSLYIPMENTEITAENHIKVTVMSGNGETVTSAY